MQSLERSDAAPDTVRFIIRELSPTAAWTTLEIPIRIVNFCVLFSTYTVASHGIVLGNG